MDVFALRKKVIDEYKEFATSFTIIHAHDIRTKIEAIYDEQRYWPEPLLQINPNYEPAQTIDELIAEKCSTPDAGTFSAPGRTANGHCGFIVTSNKPLLTLWTSKVLS